MRPLLIKGALGPDDTRGVRAALCTTLALLLAAAPAFARPERRVVRHGHGSSRSEIVLGTSHRDTLFGRGGNDTLRGGRGADRPCRGARRRPPPRGGGGPPPHRRPPPALPVRPLPRRAPP